MVAKTYGFHFSLAGAKAVPYFYIHVFGGEAMGAMVAAARASG